MDFNHSQRAAVEHPGGHLLVLAGAGTGKTRVITGRTIHLIRGGAEPSRLLLLTFTRRAALEMKARLRLEIGPAAEEVPAGTFHHFCLARMRAMPRAFGEAGRTVIDRDDQLQIMRMVRAAHRKKGERFPQASELVQVVSFARNSNITLGQYMERFEPFEEEIVGRVIACAVDYEARKRAAGYMDFDDILFSFALKLHGDEGVRKHLQGLFDHILVDEMQDTNPLQMLILEGLRDPAMLFCVGDDAQSIYAFRGADFRNVHRFAEMIPGAEILRLEENYRSSQGILDLANWLLAESPLEYDRKLEAVRGQGPKPMMLDFDSDLDESAWIVGDLIERHDAGARWADHMIIARAGYSARATEAALIEKKIPYRYVGGTQLFQAAHVKDVLCMIRCVASILDEIAWMRYLTLWPGIGDRTASSMASELASLEDPTPERVLGLLGSRCGRNPGMVEGLERVASSWNRPREAVGAACAALDERLSARYPRWDARKRDLELLVRLSARHGTIEAFLETYALDPLTSSMVARLEEEDCVTLITAHSAKGTEAPVCYLVKAEPGQYPHVRSLGDEDAVEEERRVLYVAVTRARDQLTLTRSLGRVCPGRGWGLFPDGPQGYAADGYFLTGVPAAIVETGTAGKPVSPAAPGVILPWRSR
jgi:DNA helicase-2/ATP-dependent DNA helicase PcrA